MVEQLKRRYFMNNELERLKKDIRQSLVDGDAVLVLDRLHTLTVKKIRSYCVVHDIDIVNDKGENYPLHSLIAMLTKYYSTDNIISEFSVQALKQSISLFERFNDIRNNRSYAHDNNLLSNEESLYVVNCIINMLNFLNYIETGESQLISSSIVNLDDIYKCVCLNYGITTKEIANKFNISIEETKNMLMELFEVNEIIRPVSIDQNPEEENCQWSKMRY